jgi:hypothetical protein
MSLAGVGDDDDAGGDCLLQLHKEMQQTTASAVITRIIMGEETSMRESV